MVDHVWDICHACVCGPQNANSMNTSIQWHLHSIRTCRTCDRLNILECIVYCIQFAYSLHIDVLFTTLCYPLHVLSASPIDWQELGLSNFRWAWMVEATLYFTGLEWWISILGVYRAFWLPIFCSCFFCQCFIQSRSILRVLFGRMEFFARALKAGEEIHVCHRAQTRIVSMILNKL